MGRRFKEDFNPKVNDIVLEDTLLGSDNTDNDKVKYFTFSKIKDWVSGLSQAREIEIISADQTLEPNINYLVDATGGRVNLLLPFVSVGDINRYYITLHEDSNHCKITVDGGQLIDGKAFIGLATLNGYLELAANGIDGYEIIADARVYDRVVNVTENLDLTSGYESGALYNFQLQDSQEVTVTLPNPIVEHVGQFAGFTKLVGVNSSARIVSQDGLFDEIINTNGKGFTVVTIYNEVDDIYSYVIKQDSRPSTSNVAINFLPTSIPSGLEPTFYTLETDSQPETILTSNAITSADPLNPTSLGFWINDEKAITGLLDDNSIIASAQIRKSVDTNRDAQIKFRYYEYDYGTSTFNPVPLSETSFSSPIDNLTVFEEKVVTGILPANNWGETELVGKTLVIELLAIKYGSGGVEDNPILDLISGGANPSLTRINIPASSIKHSTLGGVSSAQEGIKDGHVDVTDLIGGELLVLDEVNKSIKSTPNIMHQQNTDQKIITPASTIVLADNKTGINSGTGTTNVHTINYDATGNETLVGFEVDIDTPAIPITDIVVDIIKNPILNQNLGSYTNNLLEVYDHRSVGKTLVEGSNNISLDTPYQLESGSKYLLVMYSASGNFVSKVSIGINKVTSDYPSTNTFGVAASGLDVVPFEEGNNNNSFRLIAESEEVSVTTSETGTEIVGSTRFKNDVTFEGNIYQIKDGKIVFVEELKVADNLITVNNGETGAGVTAGSAGIEVDRGSLANYQFIFDEADDAFKIGQAGDLQKVATRLNNPTDGYLAKWDSLNNTYDELNPDIFALANHNHDSAYAALSHNHDSAYAALSHNHDSVYMRMIYDSYYGLAPAGTTNTWVRTTINGILPYESGGASALGTSSWQFNTIYGKTIYENATALSSKYLGISAKAADSNLLDGIDSSKFLRSDTSDTFTGNLTIVGRIDINNPSTSVQEGTSNSIRLMANGYSTDIGCRNSSYCHYETVGTSGHYFYENVIAPDFVLSSDIRFKKNVKRYSGGLRKILAIEPVNFDWDDTVKYQGRTRSGHDLGVIAQQLRGVDGLLVNEDDEGYLSVKYNKLVIPLIAAFQELYSEFIELKNQINGTN